MNAHNPYTPPTAPVIDAPLPEPVAAVRKPVSVWLLQIVCGLASLAILTAIPNIFERWRATSPGEITRAALFTSMLVQLVIMALFVWTLIAAQRRSQFGRWLGVFLLGSMIAIMMLTIAKSTFAAPESFAQVLGRYTGGALVIGLPGSLLYFSAFSKRARAWYARS